MARLLDKYRGTIRAELMGKFGLDNFMAAPRLEKIVVSMGLGKALVEKERQAAAIEDLAAITGQQPVVTKAKKSVSGFKLREGMPVGLMVTLRGRRMYEFLDRFISVVIPRIRDFRGLPPEAFDHEGNYSMGLGEQVVFPEIDVDKMKFVQGMNINIVVRNTDPQKSFELLKLMGMPFRQPQSLTNA